MTAAEVVKHLGGHKVGSGWLAKCPAHDDRIPSLSVRDCDGGKILAYCHAGCLQEDVINALKSRGLWPGRERVELPRLGELVAAYNYTDENNELLYQVCRFEPKTFRPRRLDGSGAWHWGYGDARRVPYRLHELLEAAIVLLPEGERDVETLRFHGFTATTNPGGANGWRHEFNEYFTGREVVILPDNDSPGWNRALQIARELLPFAAAVRVLDLPGAKDVTAWFEQGHSELELIAQLESASHAMR